MTTTQERIKRAIDATASQISPDSLPPLKIEPLHIESLRPERWHPRGPRRWLRLFTPLAAAGSVAAVLITVSVVAALPGSKAPHRHSARTDGQAADQHAIPPYFIDLAYRSAPPFSPFIALVRSSASGSVIARIAAPRPYGTFSEVTAAADDHTFVLGAQPWWPGRDNQQRNLDAPTRFFLLRIDPSNHIPADRIKLTKLPIAEPRRTGICCIALSPDGSKLAVIARVQMQVFAVPTGKARIWSARGLSFGGMLSWAADDRHLEFSTASYLPHGTNDIWLLDTTALGLRLTASSRLVLSEGPGLDLNSGYDPVILTPDGQRMIVVLTRRVRVHGHGVIETDLDEFSVPDGRLIKVLHRHDHMPVLYRLIWASAGGRTLILTSSLFVPNKNAPAAFRVGIFSSGHFTRLPTVPLFDITTQGVAW